MVSIIDEVPHNISRHPLADTLPAWSPNGSMLAFTSDRDGNFEVYVFDLEHGLLLNVTRNPAWDSLPRWSLDGTILWFQSNRHGDISEYQIELGGHRDVALYLSGDQA